MPVTNNHAREKETQRSTRDTHCRIILGVGVKSVGERRDKSFAYAFVACRVFTRLRHVSRTIPEYRGKKNVSR